MANQYIKFIDIFASQPELRFDSNPRNTTLWGGIITICITGLMIAGLAWYSQDVINRDKPDSLYIEEFTKKPERNFISPTTLNLAIGVQNPISYEEYIDQGIYRVEIIWQRMTMTMDEETQENTRKWENIQLRSVPCTKEHFQFGGLADEFFNSIGNLKGKICIDLEDLENLKPRIEGDFNADEFSVLKYLFFECKPDGENQDGQCQPQSERDRLLQNAFVAVYYPDNLIQLNQFQQPFQRIGKDFFTETSIDQYQLSKLYERNYYIETDVGFLLEDIFVNRNYVQTQDIATDTFKKDRKNFDSPFYQFQVRMEKTKNSIYQRRYQKIQHVVPELGGLLKILTSIGFLLCFPISYLDLKLNMVKKHYEFKKNNPEQGQELNQNVDPQIPYELKLSPFQYVKYYLFPFGETKKKKKIIDESFTSLAKHLDTQIMTSKMVDIEKIKLVMMDENQIELFDYIPKPMINVDEILNPETQGEPSKVELSQSQPQFYEKQLKTAFSLFQKKDVFHHDKRTPEQKMRMAYKAYRDINLKEEMNELDRRLIQFMHPSILKMYSKEYEKSMGSQLKNSKRLETQPNIQLDGKNLIIVNSDKVIEDSSGVKVQSYSQYQGKQLENGNDEIWVGDLPYVSPREENEENPPQSDRKLNISGIPQISQVKKKYVFDNH